MSITIPNPQTKTWVQPNTSDVLGNISTSMNIDLQENVGKMRIARRMLINTASTDGTVTNFFCPVAFKWYNGSIYTLGGGASANGRIYKTGASASLVSNFVDDTSGTEPTDIDSRYSDMEVGSNGNLYATSPTKLYECVSGNWSGSTGTLTTATVHMLTSYAQRLYVTNLGNKIYSCDTSTGTMGALATSGAYTLALGTDTDANTITFLRSSISRIWIGTVNPKGGKGYIYEWDGAAQQTQRAYRIEASGALACVIKDETPYVVDSNSNLLVWSGGAFVKIAQFYRKRSNPQLLRPISTRNERFIHPNGMSVVNGKIQILINNCNNDNLGTIDESIPSGVWEYTPENGLVHKHALGLTTSAGTIIDYGQNRLSKETGCTVGAISELISPTDALGSSTRNGTFLVGANIYTDATTVKSAVWYDDTNDTLQKAGYIVTPQIESAGAMDTFQKIGIRHKPFLTASDRIIIKSISRETEPVEATITWTSTTTFTVLNSDVVVSNFWTTGTSGLSGEVEIVQGLGSGKCCHITNAVNNAGTWTVTVDETFTSATGTSKARFALWYKVGTISSQTNPYHEFPIPAANRTDVYNKYKIWCLFTGKNEFTAIDIISKIYKQLV